MRPTAARPIVRVARSVVMLLATLVVPSPAATQGAPAAPIRLNQVGFHAGAQKVAVVVDSMATRFAVLTERGDTVFAGALSPAARWEPSGEVVRRADFGRLTRPGRYVLAVPGLGRSAPFVVGDAPYRDVARAAIKAFYFQRTSTPLLPAHAGRWARPAGHADDSVLVHPSAASPARPAGTVLAAPGGWYDAGDYNKYVVNSAISTYTLLLLAEHHPAADAVRHVGIPESGGALPDALDEALWNLRWMRRMQDPADGGVYHKLTNADFDAMDAKPGATRLPRYVVQKSTAAALGFAATAAHAALVVRAYPRALPGLADSLVRESLAAWGWARRHPDVRYEQDRINATHAPKITTGTYGDRSLVDERRWAAAELHLATRADSFLVAAEPLADPPADVPAWNAVRTLGLYSLIDRRRDLPRGFDTTALLGRLAVLRDTLVARAHASPYGVPMVARDFVWGSNAVAANQGMALVQAWRATGDTAALRVAHALLDYLLGRNATGYSFVTGHGARPPIAPHHRPSQSDTVVAPVPGMLVGGPNPGQQDGCSGYPTKLPARSYVDDVCSYASNEIAINWNAPFAYLAASLDAIGATRRPAR